MSASGNAGLIFDMDDTLIATSAIWQAAARRLLASVGQAWSEDLAVKTKGMNAADLAATVHRAIQPEVERSAFGQRMRTMLIEAFEQSPPQPMPGVVALVRRLQGSAPMAVASGSPPQVIDAVLERAGLADAFAITLSSESVARGKPHPDVFLAAAEALGVRPRRCVVFEDSVVGARAAQAAGMACFVVPSLASPQFASTGARVVADWSEVGWPQVAAALGG